MSKNLTDACIRLLPKESQDEVYKEAEYLRKWISENEEIRYLALSIIGLEISEEQN